VGYSPTVDAVIPSQWPEPQPGFYTDQVVVAEPNATFRLWLPLVAILGAGGFGAWMFLRESTPAQAVTPPKPAEQVVVAPPPTQQVVPPPGDFEQPPPQPASSDSSIEVQTMPAGATVLVGKGVACKPTPCSFQARRGEPLHMSVELASYKPEPYDVTPAKDDMTVVLKLTKKKAPSPGYHEGKDGLLVPDALSRPKDAFGR
jgi:hypothetical protein